jgi:hypothetical protein
MRNVVLLLAGLACCTPSLALAAEPPRGTLLELHSCELYAGGCVVSSEATLGGRYLLRAWHFAGGSFNGVNFTGLEMAALVSASENLAASQSAEAEAVVYLPESAGAPQRDALLAWLKSADPDLRRAVLHTRVVPLRLARQQGGYTFTAGSFLSLATAPPGQCQTGACGEALWYQPHIATSLFTVAVNCASHVAEPLLQLKWDDAGKRSVFVARFGDRVCARNQFVAWSELCGASSGL